VRIALLRGQVQVANPDTKPGDKNKKEKERKQEKGQGNGAGKEV